MMNTLGNLLATLNLERSTTSSWPLSSPSIRLMSKQYHAHLHGEGSLDKHEVPLCTISSTKLTEECLIIPEVLGGCEAVGKNRLEGTYIHVHYCRNNSQYTIIIVSFRSNT